MIVTRQQDEAFEPATGTLWEDESGAVYFLHQTISLNPGGRHDSYQLTRLATGKGIATSQKKADLIKGMCLCSFPVTIRNG